MVHRISAGEYVMRAGRLLQYLSRVNSMRDLIILTTVVTSYYIAHMCTFISRHLHQPNKPAHISLTYRSGCESKTFLF